MSGITPERSGVSGASIDLGAAAPGSPEYETSVVVTGTGTRPAVVADATSRHAAVPVQTRSERFRSTDPDEYPAITGREAAWKLTPVDRLRPLVDGEFDGSRPDVRIEAENAEARFVPVGELDRGRAGIPEDLVAARAWASTREALLVRFAAEESSSVTVVRDSLGSSPRAGHVVVEAAPFSRGVLVLEGRGAAALAENIEIVVGDQAQLTVVTVQEWDDEAIHVANHFATVGRDAALKHVVVSLGGGVVRVNPSVTLAAPGSDGDLLGLYFSDAGQHLEQQVFLFHEAEHTKGRVTYKGALQGEGARSVWIGDVLIGPGATATDSYEQNRNLVLTDGTRADSIPNLEIETGDIEGAGHASATGRFDDEQLFYLQARGIPEHEARRLVVRGFLAEIVQRIGVPALEERLHDAIERELAAHEGGAR